MIQVQPYVLKALLPKLPPQPFFKLISWQWHNTVRQYRAPLSLTFLQRLTFSNSHTCHTIWAGPVNWSVMVLTLSLFLSHLSTCTNSSSKSIVSESIKRSQLLLLQLEVYRIIFPLVTSSSSPFTQAYFWGQFLYINATGAQSNVPIQRAVLLYVLNTFPRWISF